MSYLAAAEERSESPAWQVARKLLVRAKERAVEDVFCACNHASNDEPLADSAAFFDDLPGLYAQYIADDDMDRPSYADIGQMFELDAVPVISERYEYASPLEVLDELMNKANWNYQDLCYAAEATSRMTGTAMSLPCFNDIIGGEK